MSTIRHISELQFDPANARRRTQRSGGMLADSLQAVGAARSIVIDEDGVILAGNGTVEAAGQVGIEKVKVVEADGNTIIAVQRTGLTDEQKRQLAYFDNRTGELAEWDPAQIARDLDAGVDLSGFWKEEEIAALINSATLDMDGLYPSLQERVENENNVFAVTFTYGGQGEANIMREAISRFGNGELKQRLLDFAKELLHA